MRLNPLKRLEKSCKIIGSELTNLIKIVDSIIEEKADKGKPAKKAKKRGKKPKA
jgi:hypothetical protein